MRDLGLTFAGGGNRAFYQMGLMEKWSPMLLPRLAGVAAVSAGACVITVILTQKAWETNAYWHKRRDGVVKNFDVTQMLRGKRPTPHAPIYRDTLLFAYRDGGLERIQAMPFPVNILCARIPRLLASGPAAFVGLSTYSLEKKLKPGMVHPSYSRKLGFKPFIFDARNCKTPEELADLVLASSATPPFTPVGRFRNTRLLDGGLIDNVPAFVTDSIPGVKRNVVLLTRPYPSSVSGVHHTRLYIAPTGPLPINRWDYTQPHLLDQTIEMGMTESEIHQAQLTDFVGIDEVPGSG